MVNYTQGLVSATDIDKAAARVLAAKFRLGVFDPPAQVPFSAIPASVIGSDAHRALALEAAQKSALRTLLLKQLCVQKLSDMHRAFALEAVQKVCSKACLAACSDACASALYVNACT